MAVQNRACKPAAAPPPKVNHVLYKSIFSITILCELHKCCVVVYYSLAERVRNVRFPFGAPSSARARSIVDRALGGIISPALYTHYTIVQLPPPLVLTEAVDDFYSGRIGRVRENLGEILPSRTLFRHFPCYPRMECANRLFFYTWSGGGRQFGTRDRIRFEGGWDSRPTTTNKRTNEFRFIS